MLRINVVTLFPEWFAAPLSSSILGRAAKAGLVQYRVVQLRDYTHDKHQTVDDAPYGGGAGMGLKPEPFFEAGEDPKPKPPIPVLAGPGRTLRAGNPRPTQPRRRPSASRENADQIFG